MIRNYDLLSYVKGNSNDITTCKGPENFSPHRTENTPSQNARNYL